MGRMPNEHLDPVGLFKGPGFHNVVRVSGGTFIFVAGQLGLDATPKLVGDGDPAAETKQALANVETAVVEAGGKVDDIVQLRIYVTDFDQQKAQAVYPPIVAFGERAGAPTVSLIGVTALSMPGAHVEVEAIAVSE